METVLLRGRLLRSDGTTPEEGGVSIEPSEKIILVQTAETLVADQPVYYPLDAQGRFTAPLVPCQAPGTLPQEAHYILHYRTTSGSVEPLRFVVTDAKAVWDLSEVQRVVSSGGYASVGTVHDLGLRVAALEDGGTGGDPNGTPDVYEHVQETAQATWNISHYLGRDPVAVQVIDHNDVIRDEFNLSITEPGVSLLLGYDIPISGRARLI